ncbi:putative holliday junction resolvase [Abditibacterium utsteinense]|uniref:Putative pre-16S rRNA nuclease n=1 Tax=Abditibacterium utsteinense TaxID=1960156 RepID=A0A2S8SQW9_9BACT|nr:Holliday junction resolvase RuvX [Abditibacterium utsteinense]PQV63204.1 putative holliday junction resolvase [Abditibacterium utsteinense]
MIFLALDYGARRLGLAISDENERLALPLQTQSRRPNDARGDIQNLLSLMRARGVSALVLGIPGGSDASDEMAARARRFAAQLLDAARGVGFQLAVFETDERFSSAQAHGELRAQGVSVRKSRDESGANSIDARAAAVFLQTFLDSRRPATADDFSDTFISPATDNS